MSRYAINDAILFDLAIAKAREESRVAGRFPLNLGINAAKIHDDLYSISVKPVRRRRRKFGRARSRVPNP